MFTFQANPSVGKDQPPDLASLVPSGTIDIPDAPSVPSQVEKKSTPAAGICRYVLYILQLYAGLCKINLFFSVHLVKAAKPSSTVKNAKDKEYNSASQPNAFSHPDLFVEEILNKTAELMLSEISTVSFRTSLMLNMIGNSFELKLNGTCPLQLTGDVAKQEAIAESIRKRLTPELQHLAVSFHGSK